MKLNFRIKLGIAKSKNYVNKSSHFGYKLVLTLYPDTALTLLPDLALILIIDRTLILIPDWGLTLAMTEL